MTLKFSGHHAVVMQNFNKLSAAVHELSCEQRKNSYRNNTVRRHSGQ